MKAIIFNLPVERYEDAEQVAQRMCQAYGALQAAWPKHQVSVHKRRYGGRPCWTNDSWNQDAIEAFCTKLQEV